MTKRIKYTAICKGWKLINRHLRIEIGFQRLRVFVCNCSTIVTPTKALFHVISPLGNLAIAYRTNLVVIVQKPFGHFMINNQYKLKFSQCLQGTFRVKGGGSFRATTFCFLVVVVVMVEDGGGRGKQ